MMNKHISIDLKFGDDGHPYFEVDENVNFNLKVDETGRNISIEGDRDGLAAVAKLILAVSETKGYHAHFDEETNGPYYRSTNGYGLTVTNLETVKKDKRTTDEPPPGW
jgi:hypothetical protein